MTTKHLPVLFLDDIVLLPGMIVPIPLDDAAVYRLKYNGLWNIGSPACAGDDGGDRSLNFYQSQQVCIHDAP